MKMLQQKERTARKFSRTEIAQVFLWLVILALTRTFMHAADHFLELSPEALGKYFALRWVLILHITAGGGALVLGPLQFWKRLQGGSWRLHRVLGLLYLLAILASGACALILAFTTAYKINWAYAFSLQVWVAVWFTTTIIAYRSALKKRFVSHKEWMVRSYLVTFAFIVSGLLLKTDYVQQLGTFDEISPSFFWMGWSVPLFGYEVLLSLRRKN